MTKALWLADVLRAAGLSVVEHDGWQDRGRPGQFEPVGVLCHHTSSNPAGGNTAALSTVLKGRLDEDPPLPGPLSQLLLARDGTWHVIAAGRCNHAGKGKWRTVTAGNTSFIGVEAENNGAGEPWPAKQLDSYAHGVAAILKHLKADDSMAAGHKEYALPVGRKVDPTFDMVAFRQRVQAINAGDPPPARPAAFDPSWAYLNKGDEGPSVRKLQQLLKVKVDGDFGPKTESAVKAFQRSHGLLPDGLVGPKTWAGLGIK
jgi:hypothetical protein